MHSFLTHLVLKSPGLNADNATQTVATASNGTPNTVAVTPVKKVRLASSGQLWRHHRGTLLRLLSKLKANEDARQQSLVLLILTTFPRLTRPYLRAMPYTYDPRPSYRWLANVHLLIKVYNLPIRRSFTAASTTTASHATNSGDRHGHHSHHGHSGTAVAASAASGSATTAMEHLLPSSLTVMALGHGLQHPHMLVKYTTLKLMNAMFSRYSQLLASATTNATPASSSSSSSVSPSITAAFREALRRHVPDLHIVFQLRSLLSPDSPSSLSPLSSFPSTLTLPDDDNDELPSGTLSKRVSGDAKAEAAAAEAADARLSATERAQRIQVRATMYMTWLSILEGYATLLPELVLESRLDLWLLISPHQLISLPLSSQYQLVSLVRACGITNPRLWSNVRTKGVRALPGGKRAKTEPVDDTDDVTDDANTTTMDGIISVDALPQTYFGTLLLLYINMRQRSLATHDTSSSSSSSSRSSVEEGATRSAREVLDSVRSLLLDILVATPLFVVPDTTSSTNESIASVNSTARSLAAAGEVSIWLEQISSATIPAFEQLVCRAVVNPFLNATNATTTPVRALSPLVVALLERRDRGSQPWLSWLGSGSSAEVACPLLGYLCGVVTRLLRAVQQPVVLATAVNASLGPLYASAATIGMPTSGVESKGAAAAGSRKRKDVDPTATSTTASGRLMTVDDQARLGALLRLAITVAGGAPIESKTTSTMVDEKLKLLKRLVPPSVDQLGSLSYMRLSSACEASLLALPHTTLDSVLPSLADRWQSVGWTPLTDFFFAAANGHALFSLSTVQAALPIADEPTAAVKESKAMVTSGKKKSMKAAAAVPAASASSMLSFLHSLPLPLILAHMSSSRNGDLQLLEQPELVAFLRTSLTRLSTHDKGLALRCLCSSLVTFLDLHAREGAAAVAANPSTQRAIIECLCTCIEDLCLARVNGVPSNTLSSTQLAAHLSLILSSTSSASSSSIPSGTSTLLDWFLLPPTAGAASFLSSAVTDSLTYLLACLPLRDDTVKAVAQPLLDKIIAASCSSVSTIVAATDDLPPPLTLLRLFIDHFTSPQLSSVASSIFATSSRVSSSSSVSGTPARRKRDEEASSSSLSSSVSPAASSLVACIARHHELAVVLFAYQPIAAVNILTSLIQSSATAAASAPVTKKAKSKKTTEEDATVATSVNDESLELLLLSILRGAVSSASSMVASGGVDVVCCVSDTFIRYCMTHITPVRGEILSLLLTSSQSVHYVSEFSNHISGVLTDISDATLTEATLRSLLPAISSYLLFIRSYLNPSSVSWSPSYPAAYAPVSNETPPPWSTVIQDGLCELVKQRLIPLLISYTDIVIPTSGEAEVAAQAKAHTLSQRSCAAAVEVINHLVQLGAISDKRRVKLMRKVFGPAADIAETNGTADDESSKSKKKSKKESQQVEKKKLPSLVPLTSATIDTYVALLGDSGKTEGRALFLLQSLATLTTMFKKPASVNEEARLMGHLLRVFSPSSKQSSTTRGGVSDETKRSGTPNEFDMLTLQNSSGINASQWISTINKFITSTLRSRLLHATSLQLLYVVLSIYNNGPLKSAAPIPGSSSSTDSVVLPAKVIFDMILSHSLFINAIRPSATNVPVADNAPNHVPLNDDDDQEDATQSVAAASSTAVVVAHQAASSSNDVRTNLIRLLHTLLSSPVHAAVADVDTHANLLQVLLAGYQANMSDADRLIRRILTKFERSAIAAKRAAEGTEDDSDTNTNDIATDAGIVISCRRRWGNAARRELEIRLSGGNVTSWGEREHIDGSSTSWIFANLDSSLLAKGPDVNALAVEEETIASSLTTLMNGSNTIDITRYDASYLLPFLLSYMAEASQLDCRHFVKCGALSYIVLSMSSASSLIRRAAYAAITRFFTLLERFAKPVELEEGAVVEDRVEGGEDDDEDPREGGAGPDEAAANREADEAASHEARQWDEATLSSLHPSRRAALTGNNGATTSSSSSSSTASAKKRNELASAAVAGGVVGFREQPQIAVLLTALRNAITTPFQRLPLLTTSFVGRALNVLLLADHKLYKPLNRFIIQRPALDLTVIYSPLSIHILYSLTCSC
jgi:hypothetical protein